MLSIESTDIINLGIVKFSYKFSLSVYKHTLILLKCMIITHVFVNLVSLNIKLNLH
jgi:hypothetical protein